MKNSLLILSAVFVLLGCQPAQQAQTWKDGVYRAESDTFQNKWKEVVEITVTNGKISAVTWDAINEDGGPNKDQLSREGGYKMKELGGAKAEWHEQADIVKAWLVANQSLTAPDAITGASIKYKNFFELAAKALSAAK
jgi:major membrane immunogen (membrane-anchored lipoprotein)